MINKIYKKRIYIVTEFFPPSYASTGQLLEELADELGKKYDIVVLTSIKKQDFDERNKRYKAIRFPLLKLNKNSQIGRAINGVSFFIFCFFYLFFKSKKSLLLLVSNPPFLGYLGYILNRLKKQKYFFLIHDQYPEIAINLGYLKQNSFITKIWKKNNKKIYSHSQKIIFLGNEMAKTVSDVYPDELLKEKQLVITNWSVKENIYPLDKKKIKEKYNLKNKFVIQYSGNHGLFHGLEVIIEAAKILKSEKKIVFLFIGDGKKKTNLIDLSKKNNLTNVVFKDYVPKDELLYSLNCADISLISLDERAYNLAVPSKFYGILAVGSPIIGLMSYDTDIGKDIVDNSLGYIVDNKNPKLLVEKILILYNNIHLLNKYSENSISLFKNKYDLSIIKEQYIQLFDTF